MKYIIFRMHDEEFPVLFPGHLSHDAIVGALRGRLSTSTAVPIGAGIVHGLRVVSASGESETLQLSSRSEDAALINLWGRSAL